MSLLYHYTSAAGAVGILKSRVLWASHVLSLNDSKEHLAYMEPYKKAIKMVEEEGGVDNEFIVMFDDYVDFISDNNVFVTSLSGNGDLLSQWRGYCPHGGYSLGFEVSIVEKVSAAQRARCSIVNYKQEDPIELSFKIKKLYQEYESKKANGIDAEEFWRPLVLKMHAEAPFYKDPSFREEAEWRAVIGPMRDYDKRIKIEVIRDRVRPICRLKLPEMEAPHPTRGVDIGLRRIYVSPGFDAWSRLEGINLALRSLGIAVPDIVVSTIPYLPR